MRTNDQKSDAGRSKAAHTEPKSSHPDIGLGRAEEVDTSGIRQSDIIGSTPDVHSIPIYNMQDVRARLNELERTAIPDSSRMSTSATNDEPELYDGAFSSHSAFQNFSSEEQRRHDSLLRLARDARLGCRPVLIGNQERVLAVEALHLEAPQFGMVIDLVADALRLSERSQTPVAVPPLLLLGPPGIGKTHFVQMLAEALATTFHSIPMNLSNSSWQLAGLDTSWRGAKPGKIATTLIAGASAQPLFLFDEIEKTPSLLPHSQPLDVFHSLWEPANATAFRDEYYDLNFDASHVLSVATANSTDSMPHSLLDRLLVAPLKAPTRAERRLLAERIYAQARRPHGSWLASKLTPNALDLLAGATPRRISRILLLAIPRAAAAGRSALTSDDLEHAANLLDKGDAGQSKQPIGFGLTFANRDR